MNELRMLTAIADLDAKIDRQGKARPTRPVIFNIPMPLADTEYKWFLPKHTKTFRIHCRDGTAFRFSFEMDKVASSSPPYITVRANGSHQERNLDAEGLILYVACGSTDKVVEGIAWS